MGRYLLRRLIQAPLVLLILITCTFVLVRVAPGGPFDAERKVDPAIELALKAKYRLDLPPWRQYLAYLGDLARGDLGPSFKHKARTVNEIVAAHLPHSLLVGGLALALALTVGLLCGALAAVRHNTIGDWSLSAGAMVFLALPAFVVGPLLAWCFGAWLQWPAVNPMIYDGFQRPGVLLLAVTTLALPFAAKVARLTRAGLLDIVHQDFIRTARACGLPGHQILFAHALRGGVLPLVSFLGPAAADLLTGSLVVEQVFNIPGLGREFVDGALNRDYTLVMGTVVLYGALLVGFNLLSDLALGLLDPRVRLT